MKSKQICIGVFKLPQTKTVNDGNLLVLSFEALYIEVLWLKTHVKNKTIRQLVLFSWALCPKM